MKTIYYQSTLRNKNNLGKNQQVIKVQVTSLYPNLEYKTFEGILTKTEN